MSNGRLVEFVLMCPACGKGKMIRHAEPWQNIIVRRCNECGCTRKYARFPVTDSDQMAAALGVPKLGTK